MLTLSQMAHKAPEVIRLLHISFADLDHISEVSPNLSQQFETNGAFAVEQAVQRVLVVARLLLERVE